ncbi:NRPS-like enzyme [Armillaria solidipes]|uniref:NRPS-like enzyme n=1 Tax=Armillaria solidipes TaxID=1076256 RepID=A0A2H3CEU5_9AGAR|nr:NRPS-like enzyme [Armillaria solidipes]
MALPTPQGVSSLTFKPPPLDGSLTFPELFDYNATHSPKHPLFRYNDPDNGGFRTILWEEGVAAFHTAGHYFKKYIHGKGPVTVGILANINSITYFAVLASLMRLGFIPFPISIRNPVPAIVHLMKSTGARHLIVSQDTSLQNTVDEVCRQLCEVDVDDKIITIPAPHFSDLFYVKPGEYDPLPHVRPDWSQMALVSHSSGSTRVPSPIYTTHKNILRKASRPYYGEMDICGEVFGVQAMPMYHSMGFLSLSFSTSTGVIIASFPPVEPPLIPTAERFLSSIIDTKTTLVVTVPSFLVEWARDSKSIDALKSTTAVMYGGGPLEKDAGNTLVANGIFLVCLYGLTECGVSAVLPKSIPMGGWEWITAGSNVDVVFVPTDEKDIYRLYIKEGPHHESPAVFNTEIDGVRAFDTKDLVQLHPSNRKLFKICGRADDQITHSTGEKTNPGPMEAGLAADKRVAAALMFGRSKFQPGILILPAPEETFDPSDTIRLVEYRTKIWDTIMKVNEQAPQQSRIYKEMILVAKPSKPFEFTAKGTVRRKAVLKAYDQEIEDLYRAVDDASHADIAIPQLWSLGNVMTMIRDIVTAVLVREISDSDDIFVAGGDSLTAMSIRNSVLRALHRSKVVPVAVIRGLPPNFVFDLPSITAMSTFVHGIVLGAHTSPVAEQSTSGDEADEAVYPEVKFVSDRNIIKLRDGAGEPPLVVIHGAGGLYFEYASYADKFRTAVWALTIVPGTPLNSLSELASFYFAQIKAERPHGPYRFASYSSSSLLLVVLVKLFEGNGDEVAQAVMLDHFPAMFVYSANRLGNPDPRVPENIRNLLDVSMDTIAGLMDRDSNRDTLQRTKNFLLDGWKGVYANDIIRNAIRNIKGFRTANAEFVYDLTTDETGLSSFELMAQWMRTVKVPITVVVAPEGALGAIPEEDRTMWADLGTKRCLPDARVVLVKGGHYEFLTDEVVLQLLQEGY